MKVIDGGDIMNRLVAKLVRGPVGEGSLDSRSGEPACKTLGVVVAATRSLLKSRHATELGTPDDEGFLQQTSTLEIFQKGGAGLVENGPVLAVLIFQMLVSVPVAHAFATCLVCSVEELDEAHAFLDQPSGEDTVLGKGRPQFFQRVGFIVSPVFPENTGCLLYTSDAADE